MNRFPLWKNVMVFTVVFVSAVLALPNLFGEDEAVQVSRADGVAMDAAALEQKPMALGLDLRGGVHFLYQVDLNQAIRQYLSTYESDLRTQLREAKIRNDVRVVADPSSPERSLLQVAIIEPGDLTRAEQIIKKLDSGDQLIQLGKTS